MTAIIALAEKPVVNRLKNSRTVEDAIKNRKRLIRLRIVVSFLFLTLISGGWAIYMWVLNQYWYSKPMNWMPIVVVLIFVILELSRRADYSPFGKISTLTKENILNSGQDFILYLRGFDKDTYTQETLSDIYSGKVAFSEKQIVKKLSQYLPVYAVGMTKEIESPSGAERLYLSDDTWHEDVLDLMKAAKRIVIRVDDKPNCVWELKNAMPMRDKVTYVITDVQKYKKIASDGVLPYFDGVTDHSYLKRDNGQWSLNKYDPASGSSYKHIANDVMQSTGIKKIHTLPLIFRVLLIVIGMYVFMWILSMFKDPVICRWVFYLTLGAGCLLYMLIFDSRKPLRRRNGKLMPSLSLIIISILFLLGMFYTSLVSTGNQNANLFMSIAVPSGIILYGITLWKNNIYTLNLLLALAFTEMFLYLRLGGSLFFDYLSCLWPSYITILACGILIRRHYNQSIVPRHSNFYLKLHSDFISGSVKRKTDLKKGKDNIEWLHWSLILLLAIAQNPLAPILVLSELWPKTVFVSVTEYCLVIGIVIKWLAVYVWTKHNQSWCGYFALLIAILNILVLCVALVGALVVML